MTVAVKPTADSKAATAVEELVRRGRAALASFAEADRHDLEYWLSLPVDERLAQVWRMSVELWRWRGEFRDESGLCRSVAHIRRP